MVKHIFFFFLIFWFPSYRRSCINNLEKCRMINHSEAEWNANVEKEFGFESIKNSWLFDFIGRDNKIITNKKRSQRVNFF